MFLSTNMQESASAQALDNQILIASAVNLGLLESTALNEVTFAAKTIVKLNKADKLEQLTGQNAVLIAKEKNDPLYQKLHKLNVARMNLKSTIQKKYNAQAKSRAQKILSMAGKTGAVVPPAGTSKS
jgi:H2-forming N5,N10-methylenetetrahydromethanopterin dehydrogenase-like enzyme